MKKKSKKLNNNKVSKKKYIIKTILMLVALFLVVGTGNCEPHAGAVAEENRLLHQALAE